MKHYFLMVFLQTLSFYVIGQKGNNNLEVLPYVRFDHYPEFSYVLNGRPSTDYINIKGTSFGWDLTYKVPLLANFFCGQDWASTNILSTILTEKIPVLVIVSREI